jgi:hypothetical protein
VKTDLEKQIYQAQCIGNVEPIEYMIPYPSMRSLIEGQNIKFAEQVIFEKLSITNLKFYELIQQTAHWLDSLGLKPKERIILTELDFPQTEILLFGIWHMGAIAVIPANESLGSVKKYCDTNLVIESGINLFDAIKDLPTSFDPKYKPLLDNEALVTFEKGVGIRLSHYNLLVNTNSIQKVINLKSRTRFSCNLKPVSSAWAVLKAILPIYCGCIFDIQNPEFTIGEADADFIIRKDLENLNDFGKNELAVCPENAAILTKGKEALHLTEFHIKESELEIHGHSVMMGYVDDALNEERFRKGAFFLNILNTENTK